jgi:hypothetical protein
MKTTHAICAMCLTPLFLIWTSGSLCAANLDGSLFLYNPGGQSPTALNGYQVELVDSKTQSKTDSSVTDSYGRFSFQGIGEGDYSLVIYSAGRSWKQQVFQQSVRVPGSLKPIVLPAPPPPIIPCVDFKAAGKDLYLFRLWVEISGQTKKDAKKVEYYFNHPTFVRKNVVSENPANNFQIDYTGWGCLSSVGISVSWNSGAPPSRIDFNMCDALKGVSDGKSQVRSR